MAEPEELNTGATLTSGLLSEDISISRELYERQLLSQIKGWASGGLSALKKEKAYVEMQKAIDYIDGKQVGSRSKSISTVYSNRLKKVALEVASAMTDVRPIWNYETTIEGLKKQGELFNKLARAWWRNGKVDRKLQSILLFACAGGSGYGALIWNHKLPGGGDIELIPYDPRDVLPIGPVYSDSIQDWRGVMLRQRLPISEVKGLFPTKAWKIGKTSASWFAPPVTATSKALDIISTAWGLMAGKEKDQGNQLPDTTDLIRIYLKDDAINTGLKPKVMGDPETNGSYTVLPLGWKKPNGDIVDKDEAKLYPRGRLIICTPDAILFDGPSPYWHGMFPVIKFTLDPLPWTLLGSSMIQDLIPLQDSLNETLRGLDDGIAQWVRRAIVADKKTMSKETLRDLDSRRPGLKAHINPSMGEGFRFEPGPSFPVFIPNMLEFFQTSIDDNSGVRGLQQLTQLKQMPAADTVEQFMDALSPLLRGRGRSLEVSLSEIAEMLKMNFLQYYDGLRRVQMLGPDGATVQDFDLDPNNMIPEDIPGETREERALKHNRSFSFSIAPNSFLNVSHATQKMLMLQLFGRNGIDIYSLWEALDVPNIGPIPEENVPDRMIAARKLGLQPGPTPELVQVQIAAAVVQAQAAISQVQGALAMGQMPLPSPGNPGIGGAEQVQQARTSGVGPQGGRPPSGQELPQMIQKNSPEGPRTTISESGR